MLRAGEFFILTRHREARTEEKVCNAILAQNTVYDDSILLDLKVNALIIGAKTVERFPFALNFSKRSSSELLRISWFTLNWSSKSNCEKVSN